MKATGFTTGKYFFTACLLLLVGIHGVLADESINRLTESEARSGWELLFDGTSLHGFKGYQQDTPGARAPARVQLELLPPYGPQKGSELESAIAGANAS